MSEVPFGNAYDECARCGSWRYTHATSDAAKGCPGFKEEGPPRKDSRRRYDEAQAKQVAALKTELAKYKQLHEMEAAARNVTREELYTAVTDAAHLRDRVENLRAWAKSRIVHCAEVEAKYLKTTRYDIPFEPVERRQEKRTLEAVLAMLDGAEQNT